jgi:hypothetical protein
MISPSPADVVRGVAGYGLPHATSTLPLGVLDDETWNTAYTAVVRQRVTGHLVHALQDGAFLATDDQRAAANEAHEKALALALLLERLLLTTLALLHAGEIVTRVLRGPAIAHTLYPEPGLRSFGDVDLLVAPRDYDAALALLRAHGARRRFPEPRRGFDRRFGKGACLVTPDHLEVDLHRTFVAGPFGLAIEADELFGRSTKFSLGGQTLHGLDSEARFLEGCFHAAIGDEGRRLASLRDVAQMVLCSDLDVARVRELCQAWQCGIVVRRAIGLTWDAFGLDATPEVVRWARELQPTTFERQALHAYSGANRSYARQTVAGLHAVRGLGAKAMYAGALLVPTRAYLRARDGGYLRRSRRAVRLFRDDRAALQRNGSRAR